GVAIVSETMVAQFWRDKSPMGQRLRIKGRWRQVVGVARDIKFDSLFEAPRPLFYLPLRQNFSTQLGIFIRTSQSPDTLTAALVREIHALDPNIAPYEVVSMREQVDRSTSAQRVAVTLLG